MKKIFTVAPPASNQNDCVYVPAITMMWRRCKLTLTYIVPAWLSVNHWWYQLLFQSWVARVWCLWTLTQWLMTASTMMNCCWNDCCQRSANYPVLLFVHSQSWTVM